MKHPYRQGLRPQVVEMAARGYSVRDISEALSADQSYVRTTLRRNGFVRVVRWVREPEPAPPLVNEAHHGSG